MYYFYSFEFVSLDPSNRIPSSAFDSHAIKATGKRKGKKDYGSGGKATSGAQRFSSKNLQAQSCALRSQSILRQNTPTYSKLFNREHQALPFRSFQTSISVSSLCSC
jgi:hypothetical protein